MKTYNVKWVERKASNKEPRLLRKQPKGRANAKAKTARRQRSPLTGAPCESSFQDRKTEGYLFSVPG